MGCYAVPPGTHRSSPSPPLAVRRSWGQYLANWTKNATCLVSLFVYGDAEVLEGCRPRMGIGGEKKSPLPAPRRVQSN